MNNIGLFLAILGAALTVGLSGIGSARGVGLPPPVIMAVLPFKNPIKFFLLLIFNKFIIPLLKIY